LSGAVNIQSPVSNLSGSLATLPQQPLQGQHLLRQRCAAQANGQLSSLVIAGRDALPAEPGGWLMSPMAFMADEFPAHLSQPVTGYTLNPSQQNPALPTQPAHQWNTASRRSIYDRGTGCGS
jgi:hypothetical protein